MKIEHFENLLTTNNIELNLLTLGKLEIKSMETDNHGSLATCNGYRSLASFFLSGLKFSHRLLFHPPYLAKNKNQWTFC